MSEQVRKSDGHVSPFEKIKRVNAAGNEYWSSRDFAGVLGYTDYRNFEQVVRKARMACFNSGERVEDHFVDITEIVAIGSGAQREVEVTLLGPRLPPFCGSPVAQTARPPVSPRLKTARRRLALQIGFIKHCVNERAGGRRAAEPSRPRPEGAGRETG